MCSIFLIAVMHETRRNQSFVQIHRPLVACSCPISFHNLHYLLGIPLPLPLNALCAAPGGNPLCGACGCALSSFRIVSSTLKIRHAASVAACIALILTRLGSQTCLARRSGDTPVPAYAELDELLDVPFVVPFCSPSRSEAGIAVSAEKSTPAQM